MMCIHDFPHFLIFLAQQIALHVIYGIIFGMNLKTSLIALAALAVGVAAGWIAKPAPVAEDRAETQKEPGRKARIADAKSRVKVVTTVVTNTVRDTVTNTVEIARDTPPGPEGWRAELERLKEENPAEYAARTNRMAQFRNRMLQRTENRLETLAAIDTTGWSKRQIATHEKYQDLIARREELMDILRPDSGATDEQRKEAMELMRQIGGELHATGREERNILLNQTLKALGYTGSAAAEIKEAIQTIYSTTQDWGGPGGRPGGRHGGPPPRH